MKEKVLLIIDPQNDFIDSPLTPGSLAVSGAHQDMKRLGRYIEQEGAAISDIVITLDTHSFYDIGHKDYWVNSEGNSPSSFTVIEAKDIEQGVWQPINKEKKQWVLDYAYALEAQGKYKITVWPTHCIDGTWGHKVEENLATAIKNWEQKTQKQAQYFKKGMNPDTENYSIFKAEVPIAADKNTQLNKELIQQLSVYQAIEVAGEALSHCVASSVIDLVDNIEKDKISHITLLKNCMSSVNGFENNGNLFLENMKNKGVGVRVLEEKIIPKMNKKR